MRSCSFSAGVMAGCGLLCVMLHAGDAVPKHRPAPHRVILCNDGGTLGAPDMEAPIGIEGLVKETIDPLRDTMVDTLFWQLGTDPYFGTPTNRLSDWFSHNTKVGARWGEGRDKFNTAGEWRIYENARQIMEQGTDPAAVVIEYGHKAGLDVFLSFRFNDQHDRKLAGGLQDVNLSRMKKEHLGWLLGDGNPSPFAYNFALPEVRQYRMALMAEAIANYDLDGLDLDFCRFPILFKPGEGVEGAALINDMMRQVRELLDAKSKTVGRRLELSVRVPFYTEKAKREGIDAAYWIKERLVDVVAVGDPDGWNYRLPVEEYKAYAAGTGCRILAQNLCAFKEARPRSAKVLFGEKDYYDTEMYRAVAAKHWQAGADGMYIWNQHFLKFSQDDRFDRQSWKEIGSPEVLARKDKHYLVGPRGKGGSLPINLSNAGDPARVDVEIADDIEGAQRQDVLRSATLRLMIEQLTSLDQVAYQLNGVSLDQKTAKRRYNYNESWLDFDVAKALRKGHNLMVIQVTSRNPHVGLPLTVRSVEALVRYK